MYDPQLGGAQVHDFNPGIEQSGLFWTGIVPHDSVNVDVIAGRATLDVQNLHMKDYFDVENAVSGSGAQPAPSVVSYRVAWTALGAVNNFDNVAQQFRGTFRAASAQMEWQARTPDFDFVSAPLAMSTTDGAELGVERNGSFY